MTESGLFKTPSQLQIALTELHLILRLTHANARASTIARGARARFKARTSPEPQPVASPESTEPEQPTIGPLITGDFVDDHSILRSIDFVAHTVTLEFPSIPKHGKNDTKHYHNLLSTFKVVPITKLGVAVDTLYAGQVLHRLVEYARTMLSPPPPFAL